MLALFYDTLSYKMLYSPDDGLFESLNMQLFFFRFPYMKYLLRSTDNYWLSGSMLFGYQLDDRYSVNISHDRPVCRQVHTGGSFSGMKYQTYEILSSLRYGA